MRVPELLRQHAPRWARLIHDSKTPLDLPCGICDWHPHVLFGPDIEQTAYCIVGEVHRWTRRYLYGGGEGGCSQCAGFGSDFYSAWSDNNADRFADVMDRFAEHIRSCPLIKKEGELAT